MKKFIYIFFAALLAVACVEPLQPYTGPIDNEPDEDALVTVEFSLPPMTKGTMTHDPSISTIHVAVFNQAGVLKQYEQATLKVATNSVLVGVNENNPTYSVELHMSAKPRILHFIADAPAALDSFDELVAAAGTTGEDVILNALTTSGGATAYWQRVALDKIDAYTYQGGKYTTPDGIVWGADGATSYQYTEASQSITVYVGDYILKNGHKILDGTGYFQSDYVKTQVANIPLIRNFAEITVSSTSSSNFTPKKFALVNVPKAGYVAPYDTKNHKFASAYSYNNPDFSETLSHAAVAATNYPGTLVGSIIPDTNPPTSFIDVTSTSTNKYAYMYERTVPTTQQPATCILVAGVYSETGALKDSDGNTWFKIEIADENGSYFPIYRGISYNIAIGAISGTKGYASAGDAFKADPIGDISGSVTTKTLEQISDGKGTTLWVEYVDYVATEQENKTIYYTMYYTNPSDNSITYLNNTISITAASVTHPDNSYKAITGTPTVSSGTFIGTPDDNKTWMMATVPLGTPGQNTLHSVLRIQGTSQAGKPLYRDVDYRVMGTQHFQNGTNKLNASPLKDEADGRETTLTIYLPSDLGFSMFPLTLRIEAENQNFTTMDGLPVESGPSLFNANKNAFYFLKTIQWDDYNAFVKNNETPVFQAKFKTTRNGTTSAASTNATNFAVLDKIKTGRTTTYFETATCPVNILAVEVTPVEQSVKGSETSATFRFNVKENNISNFSWSISNVTDGADFDDLEGNDTGDVITMTFQPRAQGDPAKTYTATLTYSYTDANNETYDASVEITVNQSALVHDIQTKTSSFTLSSSNPISLSDGKVSLTRGSGISYSNGNFTTSGDSNNTLTLVPTNGVTITGVTIGWTTRPGTITINGTSNTPSGDYSSYSWNGTTSSNVTIELTRRTNWLGNPQNFIINSISVTYEVDNGWV